MDWTREFDRSVPYAAEFIHEYRVKQKIEMANKRFNIYYIESNSSSPTRLSFSEEVKIHYFSDDLR